MGLTRDPEMRSLASGKNVTTFTVVSNHFRGPTDGVNAIATPSSQTSNGSVRLRELLKVAQPRAESA